MDSSEHRRDFFGPVNSAISDSALQIRAKPVMFLLLWLSLSIAPLLILDSLFLQLIRDDIGNIMNLYNSFLDSGDEIRQMYSQYNGIVFLYFGLWLVMTTFLGSVLFSSISRFRNREIPTYQSSVREGVKRFTGFLSAVFLSALSIFLYQMIGTLLGIVVLMFMVDLLYIPLILSSLFLFAGLLRFGLSPFIHLATGENGRNARRISKAFFLTKRQTVSGFFLACFLMPTILLFFVANLVSRLNVVLGHYTGILLQGLFQCMFIIVTINFTLNNFNRYRDDEAGKDSTLIDAH